jgi:beta-glucosidase
VVVPLGCVRPIAQLLGYLRVELDPGESKRVEFRVPTTRLAFSDRGYRRVVHPGGIDLWVGNGATRVVEGGTTLTGPIHELREDSPRWIGTTVS